MLNHAEHIQDSPESEKNYRFLFIIHTLQELGRKQGAEKLQEFIDNLLVNPPDYLKGEFKKREEFNNKDFFLKKEKEKQAFIIGVFVSIIIYFNELMLDRIFLEMKQEADRERWDAEIDAAEKDAMEKKRMQDIIMSMEENEKIKIYLQVILSLKSKMEAYIALLNQEKMALENAIAAYTKVIDYIRQKAATEIFRIFSALPAQVSHPEYERIRKEIIDITDKIIFSGDKIPVAELLNKVSSGEKAIVKHLSSREAQDFSLIFSKAIKLMKVGVMFEDKIEKAQQRLDKVEDQIKKQGANKETLIREERNPSGDYRKFDSMIIDQRRDAVEQAHELRVVHEALTSGRGEERALINDAEPLGQDLSKRLNLAYEKEEITEECANETCEYALNSFKGKPDDMDEPQLKEDNDKKPDDDVKPQASNP